MKFPLKSIATSFFQMFWQNIDASLLLGLPNQPIAKYNVLLQIKRIQVLGQFIRGTHIYTPGPEKWQHRLKISIP